MSENSAVVCNKYKLIFDRFLSGAISVREFQKIYLESFKNEVEPLSNVLYELLEIVFGDVDSYTEDPELLLENPSFYLNEEALRKRVQEAVFQLENWTATK